MGVLNANIKNNLFKKAGAIGATFASQTLINGVRKAIFSKIPGNKFLDIKGFLGGKANGIIKNLLFSKQGALHYYDPVWKLTQFALFPDPAHGIKPADTNRFVDDDLGGADRPKLKFNFTIEFNFRQPIKDLIKLSTDEINSKATNGSKEMLKMAFGLKQASRPNPTINYQDINFYNYRTKIATKIDYGTLTVTFYDDINNRVHDIIMAYLNKISPISNISNPIFANMFTRLGIDPEDNAPDPSGIGVLTTEETNGPIATISLVHHLPVRYDASGSEKKGTPNNIEYIFFNPKIINIILDDLDMTQSDVNTITMVFAYDSVYLKKNELPPFSIKTPKQASSTPGTGLEGFLRNTTSKLFNNATDKLKDLAKKTATNTIRRII